MSETITLQALDLSGETLTMFLRKSDGTLLNTGGDAMTESGSTGVFTATLAESRSGLGPLAVRICAGSETADNLLYDGFLVEGTTVIDSVMRAELDSSSLTAIRDGLATAAAVQSVKDDTGATLPAQSTAIYNRLGVPAGASVSADVAAVKADTASLLTRLTANAATAIQNLFHMITGSGSGSKFTTAALENGSAAGGASLEDIIAGVQSVSGGIIAAQDESALYITIGDTWTQDIESLGNLTNKTVSFAIKSKAKDADAAAVVMIVEGTGLTRLNGAATTAGWGSIEILDETAGDIRLRLESDATSLLTSGTYVDAVKALEDGDDRTLRQKGRTVVSAGVIADIT